MIRGLRMLAASAALLIGYMALRPDADEQASVASPDRSARVPISKVSPPSLGPRSSPDVSGPKDSYIVSTVACGAGPRELSLAERRHYPEPLQARLRQELEALYVELASSIGVDEPMAGTNEALDVDGVLASLMGKWRRIDAGRRTLILRALQSGMQDDDDPIQRDVKFIESATERTIATIDRLLDEFPDSPPARTSLMSCSVVLNDE
jgi:hypothetical protein